MGGGGDDASKLPGEPSPAELSMARLGGSALPGTEGEIPRRGLYDPEDEGEPCFVNHI